MNQEVPGRVIVPAPGTPQRGVFATSEIVPLISSAGQEMRSARSDWLELRKAADQAKSDAKRVRAALIIELRVWGAEATGQVPIKTSAERNEWADADPKVQQAELDADLAQTVQMAAREAYNDAQARYGVLQSMLAIERDEMKREHGDGR